MNVFDLNLAVPKLGNDSVKQLYEEFTKEPPAKLDWRKTSYDESAIREIQKDAKLLLFFSLFKVSLGSPKPIRAVFKASAKLALQVFTPKELPTMPSALVHSLNLRKHQDLALRVLKWRDSVAKVRDEGVEYVLSAEVVQRICANPPKNKEDLFCLTNPDKRGLMPYLVRHLQVSLLACINASALSASVSEFVPPE